MRLEGRNDGNYRKGQNMTKAEEKLNLETIPVGSLAIIALAGCKELGAKVDKYLVEWRTARESEHKESLAFAGYQRDTYLLKAKVPRFGTGEAKGVIEESVRGTDLFLLVDVVNHSLTYHLFGIENHMSPDDHYQDLKRIISAVGGKARRITVFMPFLYESRQDTRTARESLDCAIALQEMARMGVDNIITFDAHDPRVENAIPLHGFETIRPTYQFVKALLRNERGLKFDNEHLMIISPDEGGMSRAIYMADVLKLDMGMFYKRRDYTKLVNGRNPVIAHEFLGSNVEGKDMIIVDDMISSGESALEVARALKDRKAARIFVCASFGLFTNGLSVFDRAFEEGIIDRVLTTNLVYQSPELLEREWYESCDMSKYIAYLIDTLNHDASISGLLSPNDRIAHAVSGYMGKGEENEK